MAKPPPLNSIPYSTLCIVFICCIPIYCKFDKYWLVQVAGKTSLHLAVERQLEEMVALLVQEGRVELDREDFSGTTAHQLAASSNNINIRKIFAKETKKQI